MRQIVFLRGVNVGGNNPVPMAELRSRLAAAGFADVKTHLQSGNVLLTSDLAAGAVEAECRRVIAGAFGLSIPVLVRTRDELAEVVARDPLSAVVDDPKRYQVSFLSRAPEPAVVERLESLRAEREALVCDGREIYAWHPDGVARSRLWAELAGPRLGVDATARNWRTVTTLLTMADGG